MFGLKCTPGKLPEASRAVLQTHPIRSLPFSATFIVTISTKVTLLLYDRFSWYLFGLYYSHAVICLLLRGGFERSRPAASMRTYMLLVSGTAPPSFYILASLSAFLFTRLLEMICMVNI